MDLDEREIIRNQHELNPIFGRAFMGFVLRQHGPGRQPFRGLWRMLQGKCTLEWHLGVLSMHELLRYVLHELDVERLVFVGPCVTAEHA